MSTKHHRIQNILQDVHIWRKPTKIIESSIGETFRFHFCCPSPNRFQKKALFEIRHSVFSLILLQKQRFQFFTTYIFDKISTIISTDFNGFLQHHLHI